MARYFTYKRWRLRAGASEADLIELVRSEIVPRYGLLSSNVRLRLQHVDGTRFYLAIQEWASAEARDAALNAPTYERWFEGYQPVLRRWHTLMELEGQWEAVDVVVPGG